MKTYINSIVAPVIASKGWMQFMQFSHDIEKLKIKNENDSSL